MLVYIINMIMMINNENDEHKEEVVDNSFAKKIAKEREMEQKALEEKIQREIELGKVKKSVVKKTRKPRKKRVKKEKKQVVKRQRLTGDALIEARKTQYKVKVDVNKYNQFKVDYIKRQIHFEKDVEKKAIYIQALTKYNL